MLFYSVAAFVVTAIISRTAIANPVARDAASIASRLPVSASTLSQAKGLIPGNFSDAASARTAAHGFPSDLAARQEFPAQLYMCAEESCASCWSPVDLSEWPADQCHYINGFLSTAIVQPSGEGLPFAVAVGPPGCEEFAQIPEVNVCYNTGETFDQWELFD